MTRLATEILVIGSGAGGAPVAKELAEGGMRVAVLEEGTWWETDEFNARPREMMPRLLGVMRQFPFSTQHPGIGYVAVHPVSYTESPIYAQTFDFRVEPERAITFASEFLHDDYAYEFEALWNLWNWEDVARRLAAAQRIDVHLEGSAERPAEPAPLH